MSHFDSTRLREITISQAGLSKLRMFPKVYPYCFSVWSVPSNGRQGASVCFRGEGRLGSAGFRDVKAVNWWMAKFIRTVGAIDGLVVEMAELFGDWHERLTFLPASVTFPETFRVLYSVLPRDRDRAVGLWGEDRVRTIHDDKWSEMDDYLNSLPSAPREVKVRSVADGLNVGLPADQIDELIATAEQPIEIYFLYRKPNGDCSTRHVTIERVAGESIRALDHKDGKTKNFRLDRITNARYQEQDIQPPRER